MLRRDPAVDDADDDVLAVELEIRAQAADAVLESEEGRAVVAKLLIGVGPDALDPIVMGKRRDLLRREPGRETVHGVTVAVDLRAHGPDLAEQPVLRRFQVLDVGLDVAGRRIELAARRGFSGRVTWRAALVRGRARSLELDEVHGRAVLDGTHAADDGERCTGGSRVQLACARARRLRGCKQRERDAGEAPRAANEDVAPLHFGVLVCVFARAMPARASYVSVSRKFACEARY